MLNVIYKVLNVSVPYHVSDSEHGDSTDGATEDVEAVGDITAKVEVPS